MKQRMSRTHKHRKGFKVDCLLDRVNMKHRETQPGNLEGYMTLTFLGFYDKKGNYCVILKCSCWCVNDCFVNASHSISLN